ncbi:hypothetical protein C8Q74DRAFT_874378 [Fomes fomentarius]|nr:hypothetical protein C8Q74DRAFT_874378 [Fomes fomentarius]
MLYALVACTIALFFHTSRASPTSVTESNVTLGSNGTHLNVDATQATFRATLMLCNGSNCDAIDEFCVGIDLDTEFTSPGICFSSSVFLQSAMIVQPSGEGLPFAVSVGGSGCRGQLEQITSVNQCIDLSQTGFGVGGFLIKLPFSE